MARSLFVSRLSFYTTTEQLRRIFSPFGNITEGGLFSRLVRDPRTQRPKGFGFVSFESETDAQIAVNSLNGRIVDGRLIFVEIAKDSSVKESSSKH